MDGLGTLGIRYVQTMHWMDWGHSVSDPSKLLDGRFESLIRNRRCIALLVYIPMISAICRIKERLHRKVLPRRRLPRHFAVNQIKPSHSSGLYAVCQFSRPQNWHILLIYCCVLVHLGRAHMPGPRTCTASPSPTLWPPCTQLTSSRRRSSIAIQGRGGTETCQII